MLNSSQRRFALLATLLATVCSFASLKPADATLESPPNYPSSLHNQGSPVNQVPVVDSDNDVDDDGTPDSSEEKMPLPNVGTVSNMDVKVEKKTEKSKFEYGTTKNVNYEGANITPTQVTQVMFGSIKNQQTRIARPPVKEELELYNKILYIYNQAKNENPLGKYFHQLGLVLQNLNPKYIATYRVYDTAEADPDTLWAKHLGETSPPVVEDDDEEDDDFNHNQADQHEYDPVNSEAVKQVAIQQQLLEQQRRQHELQMMAAEDEAHLHRQQQLSQQQQQQQQTRPRYLPPRSSPTRNYYPNSHGQVSYGRNYVRNH